jgi:hypothetical protein
MKKLNTYLVVLVFITLLLPKAKAQNVGINTTGAKPDTNAILDLNTGNTARNLGFIVPHVKLGTSLTTFSPPMKYAATTQDSGMIVYNTNAAAGSGAGCYLWNGSTWVAISVSASAVSGAADGLTVTSGNVELGGANALTSNASIISGGYNLALTGTGSFGVGTASPVSTIDDDGTFGTGTVDITTASASNIYPLSNFGTGSTYIATPTAAATTYTLTLPSATANPRQEYTIVYNGSSLGTIDITSPVAGSIKSSGATVSPLALTQGSVTLQSDGTNWNVTGQTYNGPNWGNTGNAGTTPGTFASPGTNYLGTSDNTDISFRTFNTERMRLGSTANGGTVGINCAPVSTQMLTVTNSSASGIGIYGVNSAATNTNTGIGVKGATAQSNGYGILGSNSSALGTGVVGTGNNAAPVLYASGSGGCFSGLYAGAFCVGTNPSSSEAYGVIGQYDVNNANYAIGVCGMGYGSVTPPSSTSMGDIGVYGSSDNMGICGTYQTTYSSAIMYPCGIEGISALASGYAITAINTAANATAILGAANSVTPVTYASGSGGAFTGAALGVLGVANASQSIGVLGRYDAAASNSGEGVVGFGYNGALPPAVAENIGVYGSGGSAGIVGTYGAAAYTAGNFYASAVYGLSASAAAYSVTGLNTSATGIGVVGMGGATTLSSCVAGAGGNFTGASYGVYAIQQTNPGAGTSAAISTSDYAGNMVYINEWSASTHYKINGTGTMPVSCAVADLHGTKVNLHCPETPEFYFEDYGEGTLSGGKTHIDLDPVLAKNVAINTKHPLRVFIQLYDNENCKGVVVKNTTATGFDVVELGGGTSDTPFQWHIICNVKDEVEANGQVNHLQDIRFEPAAKPDFQTVKAPIAAKNTLSPSSPADTTVKYAEPCKKRQLK